VPILRALRVVEDSRILLKVIKDGVKARSSLQLDESASLSAIHLRMKREIAHFRAGACQALVTTCYDHGSFACDFAAKIDAYGSY
jgi:hypothetical protein